MEKLWTWKRYPDQTGCGGSPDVAKDYGFSGYLNEFHYGDMRSSDRPGWTVFHTERPK